jgi:hypothetical protein
MGTKTKTALALSVAAGLSCSAVAWADNCSGRYTNVGMSAEQIQVADGHMVVVFSAQGSVSSENSPFNGGGPCVGYVLATPDGKMRSAGTCAKKTAGGDTWSYTWSVEPGADKGVWKQAGGTGVFAGKTNSGWYKPEYDDGKVSMGTWGGDCR